MRKHMMGIMEGEVHVHVHVQREEEGRKRE